MMKIEYCRAQTRLDLEQILKLQKSNLPSNISSSEKQSEGFLTVEHSFELLEKMNRVCPHIIAKHLDTVVGYALCMHSKFGDEIAILRPMFREINKVVHEEPYLVMGQICIAKAYRRRGVFRGLYNTMKKETQREFRQIITEVDAENTRSLAAHYAVGFEDLKKYTADGRKWILISLK